MIPASIRFPPELALARGADLLPASTALPGGCRYEPKWDGFRVAVVQDGATTLWSRRGTDLTGIFPEIVTACAHQLPEQALFDGELVIWQDERLAFEQLLRRLSSGARRAPTLSREVPASLVLFDVLALDGTDTRRLSYDDRRELLEATLEDARPPITLSPMTTERDVAQGWSEDMAAAGIEGIVVKGGAQIYKPGERQWVKVKRRESVDVVIAAIVGPLHNPMSLVVGFVVDGQLRTAGQSAQLSPGQARALGQMLRQPSGPHPWPEVLPAGAMGRFRARSDDLKVTLVEPVMGEVSADSARTAGFFRHSVRFVKLRPDLPLPEFRTADL
ncbi:ATP-dependent DNA ligase [Microbacterium rhizosphaerae]|uniref:ATP-dependent DNA ligase n=1 Tax=Microbacterium rhizosphaerae TaxID=1678237 RepID=A0ABZ0SK02_9MICO|nr:ATP-dependent DNA ligase [Microbacterium rhizosphaerae]WPR89727.1 ATP-dependent DNA ligase [Microbacterium rhizosphaerae]